MSGVWRLKIYPPQTEPISAVICAGADKSVCISGCYVEVCPGVMPLHSQHSLSSSPQLVNILPAFILELNTIELLDHLSSRFQQQSVFNPGSQQQLLNQHLSHILSWCSLMMLCIYLFDWDTKECESLHVLYHHFTAGGVQATLSRGLWTNVLNHHWSRLVQLLCLLAAVSCSGCNN